MNVKIEPAVDLLSDGEQILSDSSADARAAPPDSGVPGGQKIKKIKGKGKGRGKGKGKGKGKKQRNLDKDKQDDKDEGKPDTGGEQDEEEGAPSRKKAKFVRGNPKAKSKAKAKAKAKTLKEMVAERRSEQSTQPKPTNRYRSKQPLRTSEASSTRVPTQTPSEIAAAPSESAAAPSNIAAAPSGPPGPPGPPGQEEEDDEILRGPFQQNIRHPSASRTGEAYILQSPGPTKRHPVVYSCQLFVACILVCTYSHDILYIYVY